VNEHDQLLTPKEAAAVLKVSYWTVLRLIKEGRILSVDIGMTRFRRIRRSDLNKFIADAKPQEVKKP